MAKEILKTHDLEFCSRPVLTGLQKLSYNGLDMAFSRYDAYWREMRKICVIHLFSSIRVQSFSPIREEQVSHMIEKISISALDSEPFNLTEAMMSLTSTIICRIAFGKSYEDGGSEKNMGIATVELSLANLLHKFDWEMPGGMRREDIDIDHVLPGITAHRRVALCLVPKPYAVMGNKDYQFS
ncbi:hypothetical protein OIU76_020192 [Salix suchowensis]|nr:hypothetical protein OIU76_020192 [Salix suchowensis]